MSAQNNINKDALKRMKLNLIPPSVIPLVSLIFPNLSPATPCGAPPLPNRTTLDRKAALQRNREELNRVRAAISRNQEALNCNQHALNHNREAILRNREALNLVRLARARNCRRAEAETGMFRLTGCQPAQAA
jgi:hypothetical protein